MPSFSGKASAILIFAGAGGLGNTIFLISFIISGSELIILRDFLIFFFSTPAKCNEASNIKSKGELFLFSLSSSFEDNAL